MELQLQRIRKRAGLNQQDMAEALGVKKRTYGSWERGEAMMSLEQAFNVTEVLGCTLEELVGRESRLSYNDVRQKKLNEAFARANEAGKDKLAEDADNVMLLSKYAVGKSIMQGDRDRVQGIA